MRDRIQIALEESPYRESLCRMLSTQPAMEVQCVEHPDTEDNGVLVVDLEHWERLPGPMKHPERVVLLTREKPSHMAAILERAWQAGIHSVVSLQEPVTTAVLAVLSARMRPTKPGMAVRGNAVY